MVALIVMRVLLFVSILKGCEHDGNAGVGDSKCGCGKCGT